ncbi:DUF2125 domain-containing protein [Caenispirillum bisanense]|uniref:DUF2125 domain-containing protein n=1 Tax=Caenispirillum bisanense TaxID=414052 RepID=A0A286GH28_9PROT|nr:DUF2125 domain-containing protein [Caenispirillum bisanense]SOD94835.1 hypothetical protein SAMN05421508_104137 [Caenispirillum bisanense]
MNNRILPAAAAVALIAVVAAIYAGLWVLAANAAKDAVRTWAEERRTEGYQVWWSEMKTTGFPSEVQLTLTEPQVRFPEADGGGGWAAPAVRITAKPWRPSHLTVTAPGEHVLNFVHDRRVYTTRSQAGEAALTLDVDGAGVEGGALAVRSLRIDGLAPGGPVELASLDAVFEPNPGGRASVYERQEERDTGIWAAFDVTLKDLRLPRDLALPIGDGIDELTLRSIIPHALPDGVDLRGRLRQWSDEGGVVEVERLTLVADPLSLGAVGTVALDSWLQPQAAFTTQLRGFFEALEQLEKKGIIRARDASIAKVVLGAMAKQPPDGGPLALELPLSIQERMLYLGPVALLQLPPLRWGGDAPPGPGEIKPGFDIGPDGKVVPRKPKITAPQ